MSRRSVAPAGELVGTAVGPYRVVRQLGAGGMGVVYEAVDVGLGRPVALKLIDPRLASDGTFRRRFVQEARALASLDSPHVVQVHAHGESGGRLYLVTQLLPDGDLAALLRSEGPPPVRAALDLVAQVATGLADAHEAGLVHRDIKPANILLRRRGSALTARLGDFGIARRLGEAVTGRGGSGTLGTPAYMAPELHHGGRADQRTDVYAVGCLLWASLTGLPPFAGSDDLRVARAHADQPVPQLPGRSRLVAEVNRILRTALAKRPDLRYPTAAALRDDLRHTAMLPSTDARGWCTRWRSAVAGTAAAASIAGTAVVVGGDGATAPDVPTPLPTSHGGGAGAGVHRTAVLRAATRMLRDRTPHLTRAEARCTTSRWIEEVGLATLVTDGYVVLDGDGPGFVDVDISGVPRRTRLALAEAAVFCLAR